MYPRPLTFIRCHYLCCMGKPEGKVRAYSYILTFEFFILFYVHKWYVCFQIHGNRSSLEEFKLELGFGLTDESVLRDLALAVFLLLSWWFLLVVVGFFFVFFLHFLA